jgi:hypothetical protein
MWGNYRALGYRRMIYINTVSVRASVIDEPTAAMGDSPAKQLNDGGIEDATADKEPTTGSSACAPGGYDPCSALRRPTAARARTPVDLFGHLLCWCS